MSSISGTWVSTGALEELGQGRPKGSTAMAKGLGQQFATLFSLRPQNGPKKFPRPQLLDPIKMFATPMCVAPIAGIHTIGHCCPESRSNKAEIFCLLSFSLLSDYTFLNFRKKIIAVLVVVFHCTGVCSLIGVSC